MVGDSLVADTFERIEVLETCGSFEKVGAEKGDIIVCEKSKLNGDGDKLKRGSRVGPPWGVRRKFGWKKIGQAFVPLDSISCL